MTFKEKIDKIMSISKLGITSVSDLEKKIGAGSGAIRRYYTMDEFPGGETVRKIKDKLRISDEWWDEETGDIFLPENTTITSSPKETFYTELIENNEEYSLIPKVVIKDYKIVPEKILEVITQSYEGEKKALIKQHETEVELLLSKHDKIIYTLNNAIKDLETENLKLKGQIPPQS